MGQTAIKDNVEKEINKKVHNMTRSKRVIVLDFVSYIAERDEWKATDEIMADKKLCSEIQEAWQELERGEFENIEL